MFNLKQLIGEPTRVTDTSATILVLVSEPSNICQSGVTNLGLSDHMLTYCTRKVKKSCVYQHNYVNLRSLKNYTKEAFEFELLREDCHDVYSNSNVDEAWLIFKSKFLSILDKISPLGIVRLKQGTDPWMTGEVRHLIHERLLNQVQNKKAVAKSEYFVNKVEESKNQPRKLWQALKKIGTSSKLKTHSKNVGLKIDNEICFDKSIVAEKCNNFFQPLPQLSSKTYQLEGDVCITCVR